MECPFCKASLEEFHQYCPKCGKLVAIIVHPAQPKMISLEQIVWTLVAGFSSIIFLLFIFYLIDLPFTFFFYLGLDSSIIISFRIFSLFIRSKNESLSDFFPYYKEFLAITGFLILFSALWVDFALNFDNYGSNIEWLQIIKFAFDYIIGYIVGLAFIGYFYYQRLNKRINPQIKYDL